MSDLERELTEALAREGEAAPGAGGLADAARRRAGVRRTRRRGALAVVAAVVVVAGATVAVDLGGGGGPRPADTSPSLDPEGDGWQTVVERGVEFEIPGDWVAHDVSRCDFVVDVAAYAPAGIDACRQDAPMARITDVSMADVLCEPTLAQDEGGLWSGCRLFRVGRTDFSFWVRAESAVARRILDSARREQRVWRTVSFRGVEVEIPADWALVDDARCWDETYAPHDGGCLDGEQASIYGNEVADYIFGPGLREAADFDHDIGSAFLGHVTVGHVDVSVQTDDRSLALRILGSARPAGTAAADIGAGFQTRTVEGVVLDVPVDAGIDVDVVDWKGSAERLVDYALAEQRGGAWIGEMPLEGGQLVRVTAPTQALALLVAASAREVAAPWKRVVRDGITFDVPSEWAASEDCVGFALIDGSGVCDASHAAAVTPTVMHPRPPAGGIREPTAGISYAGAGKVSVSETDRQALLRVLGSVTPLGEEVPDASRWTVTSIEDWMFDVPVDASVTFDLLPGQVAGKCTVCPARRLDDGSWQAVFQPGTRIAVTAPTRALAELVASTGRRF